MTNTRKVSFFPFGWAVDGFSTFYTSGNRSSGDRNNREVTGDFKLSYDNNFTDDISSTFLAGLTGVHQPERVRRGGWLAVPGSGPRGGRRRCQPVRVRVLAERGQRGRVLPGAARLPGLGVPHRGGPLRRQQRLRFRSSRRRRNPKAALSIIPTDLFGTGTARLSRPSVSAVHGVDPVNSPVPSDKFTTFVPSPAEVGPGLRPGNLGNQSLRPEISTEIEGGAEIGLWNDRVGVDFTLWTRVTSDALVARQFPVTGGFTATQLDNIGQLDAKGVELTVNGSVYNSENLAINVFANTAYISENVTDLGGAPPLKTGGSYPRYRNFLKEGYAPGSFFGAVLDPNMSIPLDVSGTSCQEPTRAQALEYFSEPRNPSAFEVIPLGCAGGSAEYLDNYIGKPTPDFGRLDRLRHLLPRQLRAVHQLRIPCRQLSHPGPDGCLPPGQRGHRAERARDGEGGVDPAESCFDRRTAARGGARMGQGVPGTGSDVGHEPDMDIRLRPACGKFPLRTGCPPTWSRASGLDNATVSLGGRNVKLWMLGDYRGIDPELNPSGQLHGRWRELQLPHRNGSLRHPDSEAVHLLAAPRLLGKERQENDDQDINIKVAPVGAGHSRARRRV